MCTTNKAVQGVSEMRTPVVTWSAGDPLQAAAANNGSGEKSPRVCDIISGCWRGGGVRPCSLVDRRSSEHRPGGVEGQLVYRKE